MLISGCFIVDDLMFFSDDNYIYFKVNMEYLGFYEVYCVDLSDNIIDIMIDLNGMIDYLFSFDGKNLLLSYSKVN